MPGKPKFQYTCRICEKAFWPSCGPQKTCDACKARLEESRLLQRKQIPNYEPTVCGECGVEYTPTSGHQERCSICTNIWKYNKRLADKEYLALHGVGTGRGQGRGPEHFSWIHGRYTYIDTKLSSTKSRVCELCSKDLSDVVKIKSGHGKWAVHHIDGDKNNNDLSNLQLLCVTCHNRLHKSWRHRSNVKE